MSEARGVLLSASRGPRRPAPASSRQPAGPAPAGMRARPSDGGRARKGEFAPRVFLGAGWGTSENHTPSPGVGPRPLIYLKALGVGPGVDGEVEMRCGVFSACRFVISEL